MEIFLDFIQSNWKWLTCALIAIIELLVVIFRKRLKVYDSIHELILSVLPAYISLSEKIGGTGDSKKYFVISSVSELLKARFNCIDIDPYIDFINDSIESILSTPQKKERS